MRQLALIGAVAVLALLAGVVVAGLPTSVVSDVVVSRRPAPTTTAPPPTRPTTTSVAPPTEPPTTEPTTAESTVPRSTTTATPTTTSTTTAAPSTAAPTTSTLVAPADLHIVVANASTADGLAAAMAARLRDMGYPTVDATTAVDNRQVSAVYFSEGLEREAQRLAAELGLPEVVARPPGRLTVDGAGGQLLVMIGVDRG